MFERLSACGEGDTVDFDRNQVFRIDRLVEVVGDADMVVSRTVLADIEPAKVPSACIPAVKLEPSRKYRITAGE